jgi:hypothetical protein
MDIDPSIFKFVQSTQFPAAINKRSATSDRTNSNQKQQRVNHVTQAAGQGAEAYVSAAGSAVAQIDDDADSDSLNFLGESPCCPSSDEE